MPSVKTGKRRTYGIIEIFKLDNKTKKCIVFFFSNKRDQNVQGKESTYSELELDIFRESVTSL